jgi:xanthine dehydrogenase YagS FAD-binding subunit
MKSFDLYEPKTTAEALAALKKHGNKARPLGGGSDLVAGVMKDWVQGKDLPMPDALVDLSTIPGLKGIKADARGITIGAMTTLTEIIEHKEVGARIPLLRDAAHSVASQLIRNYATLGGNLNQRPRCWFFRGRDFDCLKKGGDFCYSVSGDNRYHAIIGGEGCYIVHPSDTATALLALNAKVNVHAENILKPEELLTEVFIPNPAPGTKQAWTKLKNRQVYDFAVCSVATAYTVENGTWKDGRIVMGGVAPVPYRATPVETLIKGKDIKAAVKQASAAIRTVARPMSMNAYKVDIAVNMLERTILAGLA